MDELIVKAKEGDIEAFNKLISSLEKDLERFTASKLVDKSYTNDILQNALMKAFLNLQKLEDDKKFKSWLCAIINHECLNLNKSIERRKEVTLEDYSDNIIDYSSDAPESKMNFEEMISNLSDDEKKLIRMKFEENYSHLEISEELGIPYNTVKSKINRALKKITVAVLIFVIFSGFTVLATYIIKQIRAHFTTSLNAIDSAVENDYVQEIDGDFVYSNGIGIKVDAIILDDKNLDISFVYDIQDKERYGEITGIGIYDYVIRNENNVLFNSDLALTDFAKISMQHSKYFEKVDDNYRNSILFSTMDNDSFSKMSKAFIEISSIYINSDNSTYNIEGSWNLEYDVAEKLNERSNYNYYMEKNPYVKDYTVTLIDTSIKFEIEFNIKLEKEEIFYISLYNDNSKFNWIEKYLYADKIHLRAIFDIGKYTENIDDLILEIPREDEQNIILKFKRDL